MLTSAASNSSCRSISASLWVALAKVISPSEAARQRRGIEVRHGADAENRLFIRSNHFRRHFARPGWTLREPCKMRPRIFCRLKNFFVTDKSIINDPADDHTL